MNERGRAQSEPVKVSRQLLIRNKVINTTRVKQEHVIDESNFVQDNNNSHEYHTRSRAATEITPKKKMKYCISKQQLFESENIEENSYFSLTPEQYLSNIKVSPRSSSKSSL